MTAIAIADLKQTNKKGKDESCKHRRCYAPYCEQEPTRAVLGSSRVLGAAAAHGAVSW